MRPDASAFVTGAMAALAVAVALLVVAGYAVAWRRLRRGPEPQLVAGAIAAWMTATYLLADAGALARFDHRPPPFLVMAATMGLMTVVAGLSSFGRVLADGLPLAWLVGLQGFRLPLELVMHRAAAEGVMPPQMTYGIGWNYDIATGATAALLAPLVAAGKAPRVLVVAWNAMGALLLVNIVAVAVASTPAFAAFGRDPARLNTWVAWPPFVWLPAVLVAAALLGHVVVARKLASPPR